jgi:formate hydrogenlyase subunit 3/multisubunit Na+/H+ antiporter MnhD subunit
MNLILALSPIGLTLGTVVAWLVLGLAAIAFRRRPNLLLRGIFPLAALGGLGLMVAGGWGMHADPSTLILPLGLPDLPFHLREDALSGFFLFLLGGVIFPVSLFASGYFKSMPAPSLALLALQYNVFLAGMTLVLVADDAYAFLVAWEVMAVASYFLVTTDHQREECREAGFIYLLVAHVGAVAILLAFGVLKGHTSGQADYAFAAMRTHMLTPFWTSVAFLLALFGFGAKAGLLPLHVWLPEAHPEAPSPVSALMSGVMLKTAIYGLLRVTFDLLHTPAWWWGALMLALGLLTALFGVMLGAVQTDMKRLLAYSSIENIGVIILVLGLCTIFRAFGFLPLAALALTAALYHSLNHAFFKSLLFLVTGSVLHATGERRLGRLGGLIRRMPWVAGLALIGTLAAAGLPPLNGFVSEWLALQAFLLAPGLPEFFLTALIPLTAAALVLASALAAYVMVKFYGIVFLGRHREMALERAHDAGRAERLGMA